MEKMRKKTINAMQRFTSLLLVFVMFSFITLNGQSRWQVDKAHSSVKFSVTHLVISEVEGSFRSFDGSIFTNKDDFTDAVIEFKVEVNSINTDNEMRDNHLKGDDFFNSEKYPVMTFKSKSFKKLNGNKYELIGDLTIRDVTKTVKFDVQYGGTVKDPWGNTKAGFRASTEINRFDFGLKWNALTEAGGAVVDNMVKVRLNLEFELQK